MIIPNYSLFTYRNGNTFWALLVYIDDIILVGNIQRLMLSSKPIRIIISALKT